MATIGDITDGLEAAIATTGLRTLDSTREPSPPAFLVLPETGRPRTLGAVKEHQEFRVRLLFSDADMRAARDALDGYLSPTGTTSIRAAVTANKHLGLTGVNAFYTGWENYGLIEWSGVVYMGADVLITVEN